MKYLLTLALILLTSCSGINGRTFNELHNGMSQEAAMQKLGKANSVTKKGDMEMHTYTNLYGPKTDNCGNNCTKTIGLCDYYVVYQNGKVIKCGSKSH